MMSTLSQAVPTKTLKGTSLGQFAQHKAAQRLRSVTGMKTAGVAPPIAKIHVDELTRLYKFVAVTFAFEGMAQIADTSGAAQRLLAGNSNRERRGRRPDLRDFSPSHGPVMMNMAAANDELSRASKQSP